MAEKKTRERRASKPTSQNKATQTKANATMQAPAPSVVQPTPIKPENVKVLNSPSTVDVVRSAYQEVREAIARASRENFTHERISKIQGVLLDKAAEGDLKAVSLCAKLGIIGGAAPESPAPVPPTADFRYSQIGTVYVDLVQNPDEFRLSLCRLLAVYGPLFAEALSFKLGGCVTPEQTLDILRRTPRFFESREDGWHLLSEGKAAVQAMAG